MKRIITIAILALSINAFAQVPTNGLVAYYPFSGNANDMSGNGYNGTVYGTTLSMDRFGNANSAFTFNGVSDYIDLSNYVSNLNFQQPASISFWINTKYDLPMAVYSLGDGASANYTSIIYIGKNVTNTLSNEIITVFNSSTVSDYYIAGLETTNRNILFGTGWHHIVIIYNESLTTLYLDNNLIYLTYNWGINNGHYGNLTIATKALIGTRYDDSYGGFFHGSLDDIRIYNISLTPAQVSLLYQETPTNVDISTDNNSSINIYPNPTKGKLNINCDFNLKSIEVLNIMGKVIYRSTPNNLQTVYEIDLSNVPKGIYFVKINDGVKIYNKKVVTY